MSRYSRRSGEVASWNVFGRSLPKVSDRQWRFLPSHKTLRSSLWNPADLTGRRSFNFCRMRASGLRFYHGRFERHAPAGVPTEWSVLSKRPCSSGLFRGEFPFRPRPLRRRPCARVFTERYLHRRVHHLRTYHEHGSPVTPHFVCHPPTHLLMAWCRKRGPKLSSKTDHAQQTGHRCYPPKVFGFPSSKTEAHRRTCREPCSRPRVSRRASACR